MADVSNNKLIENILTPDGITLLSARYEEDEQSGNFINGYYTFNNDIRGSVTNILNNSGTLTTGYVYDEYGNQIKTGDEDFINEATYTGSIYDEESELYYMNARYYNANTGQFTSRDTYLGNAYNPQTHNLYSYTGNNPTSFVDPTGHTWYFTALRFLQRVASKARSFVAPVVNKLKAAAPSVYYEAEYGLTNTAAAETTVLAEIGQNIIAKAPLIETAKFYTAEFGAELLQINTETSIVASEWKDKMYYNGMGFSTFEKAKKYLGAPGEGKQWHHIVEQSQIKKSGFSPILIHNTNNLIAIDKDIHAKITGYYNRTTLDFTNGKSVRDWLAGQSYEEQYNFGLNVMRQFGVGK